MKKSKQIQRAYLIDKRGVKWQWNCGWWPLTKAGEKNRARPLGHKEFLRCVPMPENKEERDDAVNMCTRPHGLWRRVLDVPYEHKHTGRMGRVLMTDGVHAIFRTRDEGGNFIKLEVMFNNLNESKPSQWVKGNRKTGGKKKSIKKKGLTYKTPAGNVKVDLDQLINTLDI